MDSNLENNVRVIHGKEYIVVHSNERTFYIQDFIRFPLVVHMDDPDVVPGGYIDRIKRNNSIGDIVGACGSYSKKTYVTGSETFSWMPEEGQSCIGIHGAVLSDFATHALICDIDGFLLGRMRQKQSLPIGIFHIMSEPNLVFQWDRKSSAGMYRLPTSQNHCINQLAPGIQTEIYALDMAAGSIHFANTVLDCWDMVLTHADLSFDTHKPGSVEVSDGRFIYPQNIWSIHYLSAVAHVIMRNGGNVSCVKETMVPITGCQIIDNNIEA